MQKFTAVHGIPMSPEFKSIFCQQTTDINSTYSFDFLFLLHNPYDPLNTVKTFAWKDDIKALLPLPPFFDEVFTSEGTSQLTELYKQMYPDRDFSNILVPVSYRKFGHLMLAGNLVGSEIPGPK